MNDEKKEVAETIETPETTTPPKLRAKTMWTRIALCTGAAVLAAAGVYVGTLLSGEEPEPAAEAREYVGGRGTVVTPENLDEVLERMREPGRFAHYRTRMSIDWVFETSDSPAINMYVYNDESNPGTVFFDLVLDDEVIYSSPYIPLGARLEGIYLDVDLPPGEYSPVVIYHLVDEYYEVQATVSVGITLRILG